MVDRKLLAIPGSTLSYADLGSAGSIKQDSTVPGTWALFGGPSKILGTFWCDNGIHANQGNSRVDLQPFFISHVLTTQAAMNLGVPSNFPPPKTRMRFIPDTRPRSTLFTGVDNSDPNASVFDVMYDPKNHATATATILQYFAAQKDFHPKQQGLYRSADKFVEYEFIIGVFRPFVFKSKQNPVLKLEGGPIQLKEAIAAAYSPISGKADVVAAAFVDQIPSSADQSLSGIWDIAVITIHAGEDNKITLDMSTLEIRIHVDNDGSVFIPPQEAGLYQVTHELDPEYLLEDIADFFDDLSKVDAETFADNFSTPNPEGNNPSLDAWLFGSDHSCEEKPIPFKYTHRHQRLYRLSRLSGDY